MFWRLCNICACTLKSHFAINNTFHPLHFKIALVKAINYSLTHSLLNPPLPLVIMMIPLDDDDDGGNENVKKVSYLHKSFPRSYVKWWRNLAASSGWRIQARHTMGWDEVGREKNKPSERGAMTVESGQGEVHGCNNNLCVVSLRW